MSLRYKLFLILNKLQNFLRVGKTPLIPIDIDGVKIWGKAEFMNPSGSVKDRPVSNILSQAENCGFLKKGGTVIEATSGNAGISFAMFCAMKKYKCVIVMPSNMSDERKKILNFYGADLIEVEPGDFEGAIKLRDQLAEKNNWFNGNQFKSSWNIQSHIETTGSELVQQCKEKKIVPLALVAGTGTGGTLMGAGETLRKIFPILKLIAVEPSESPVMSGGTPGIHGIQGIGDGSKFLVDLKKISKILQISTPEAKNMAARLAKEYGIFVGISAGANILASIRYSQELCITGNEQAVLTILCDRGDRYMSCF